MRFCLKDSKRRRGRNEKEGRRLENRDPWENHLRKDLRIGMELMWV